jgi:hypothetical protein
MDKRIERVRLNAEWTDDCQGKKDFDGGLVRVSTRYWPRGGGFTEVINTPGQMQILENDTRPHIPPSAHCSVQIESMPAGGCDPHCPTTETLVDQHFEGETEADVKVQVEEWAQQQVDRVVAALRAEFKP